jgi:hypothetical protein
VVSSDLEEGTVLQILEKWWQSGQKNSLETLRELKQSFLLLWGSQ